MLSYTGKVVSGAVAVGTVATASYGWHKRDDFSIIRVVRTGWTTLSILQDYYFTLRKLEDKSKYRQELSAQIHKRSAEKLLELACINRGTYIKIGQLLGAMDYLLPTEYVSTLKVLHSRAPESTLEEIEQVIKEDLNIKNLNEVFTEFSGPPVGTASLGQVYKARLTKDGAVVAVKVQHPRVKKQADKDLYWMELGVRLSEWMFSSFKMMWLVEETKKHLPLELDFLHEAKNCERVYDLLKHFDWVKVPKVYQEFSTSRILTMEFCEGGQINDLNYFKANKIDANKVMRKLGRLYSEMIFVNGFLHCDPHPGNMLIRKRSVETRREINKKNCKKQNKGEWRLWLPTWCFGVKGCSDIELILLDHGLYQQLDINFRYHYASLWQGILGSNLETIKEHSKALNVEEAYPLFASMISARSWDTIQNHGINRVGLTAEEDEVIRDSISEHLPDISHILNDVPKPMLMIFKTNDLLRGLETFHGTRSDSSAFLDMSRCCLIAQYNYERTGSTALNFDYTAMNIIKSYVTLKIKLLGLTFYEWYLWMDNLRE